MCFDLPVQLEYKLINLVKSGDFDKASQILDEIFNKNFTDNQLPLLMAKCLMFDLISTVINKISSVIKYDFIESLNVVERLPFINISRAT